MQKSTSCIIELFPEADRKYRISRIRDVLRRERPGADENANPT
jgi:hypothetical protein